jgi:hypothetical protein
MTKITANHLDRAAFVYIRQSTADQLLHNPEGRRRQYGLTDRARQLGWTTVEVIDEVLRGHRVRPPCVRGDEIYARPADDAHPARDIARMVARCAQEGLDVCRSALVVSRLPRAAYECAPAASDRTARTASVSSTATPGAAEDKSKWR